jgi:Predicted AAA-ATPase/PD-(D/E)XK nuclease superfamily
MLKNRKFPTSSQEFKRIIENGFLYIDKTRFLEPLVNQKVNVHYFLSRPRRFGKSLLIDVFEELFKGQKELFQGLYIYDQIEWESYPVIRLSMDKIQFVELGLEKALLKELHLLAEAENILLTDLSYGGGFRQLIQKLYEKYQKEVVVLIDEYDKPIIHYINGTDSTQAEVNRTILKSFYGVLKPSGKYLRFLFITGVSKFSKVSIFSDLNHLTDLTLDERYATLCGFTETELRTYFQAGLEALAAQESVSIEAIVTKIRYWYDGFSWNGKDFVYNPYSTMRLMESLQFKNYWFESGTPTFLVNLLCKNGTYDFTDLKIEQQIYNWHDLHHLDPISIMLQTGYLTFKERLADTIYQVYYPNKEVELSFSRMLLDGHAHQQTGRMSITVLDIEQAFKRNDVNAVITILTNMFKTLPHQFFKEGKEITDAQGNVTQTRMPVGENFYHAVIYLVFQILGISMKVEVSSQEGRIDALVETDTHLYLFEFKKNRSAKAALEQMKNNKYAEHFALSKKQILLIGVAFNLRKKGISDHVIRPYPPPP